MGFEKIIFEKIIKVKKIINAIKKEKDLNFFQKLTSLIFNI